MDLPRALPVMLSTLGKGLGRWLPGSLVARVFLLYLLAWLFCVGAGSVMYYSIEYKDKIESTQQSALMLAEVVAQIVSESAVIGDYDTIKRSLDTATHQSVFARAQFIDLQGGRVLSESIGTAPKLSDPPHWVVKAVSAQLLDVNRNLVVGGRDYGVLRMSFDAPRVAEEFWIFALSALGLAALSFAGGLGIIWYPLRAWLAPFDAAKASVGTPTSLEDLAPEQIESAPRELRNTLVTLSRTATRLRIELAARESTLQSVRAIMASLEPSEVLASNSADLEELVSSLSRLVKERESMRRDLSDAVVASEAASRAKSAFLATMSHELRTPLNAILGMAQLLHLGEVDAETSKEYSRLIHSSGVTLLALLNDILDLSKIESGKLEIRSEEFSPAALLAEVASMFSASATSKGLAIRVGSLTASRPSFRGDAPRLRQMLSNLISNAIKFTHRGSITLACSEREGSGGSRLEFAVIDTGDGVPPEKRDRLFQRFVQLDDSTTRRAGGSGLGLSIVRGLAELMGGEAGFDAPAEGGSRFWFSIPMLGSASPGAATPAAQSDLQTAVPYRLRGRVLVADDSAANRIVAQRLLERLGLQVILAASGREAIRAAESMPPPDLILMDLQMPDLDGLEATIAIRRREAAEGRLRLPIVALTAAAYATDEERCRSAGMDGYIAKPILLATLARELGTWLPRERAVAGPPAA